jgi:hypothetical protein
MQKTLMTTMLSAATGRATQVVTLSASLMTEAIAKTRQADGAIMRYRAEGFIMVLLSSGYREPRSYPFGTSPHLECFVLQSFNRASWPPTDPLFGIAALTMSVPLSRSSQVASLLASPANVSE